MAQVQLGVSYESFARLRMRDFWAAETRIEREEGLSCFIGSGFGESVGSCYFLWPKKSEGELSEIRLERFGPSDCPVHVAQKIFTAVNIPLHVGMTEMQVDLVFGEAEERESDESGERRRYCVIRGTASYGIVIRLKRDLGLCAFYMWRSDRREAGE